MRHRAGNTERRLAYATLCLLPLMLFACSDAARTDWTSPPPELDDGWGVVAPAVLRADVDLLDSMVEAVETSEFPNIHSILVVKDGRLVVEEYFSDHGRDTPHQIRSATKSIGSILVGIAIDKGHLASENEPIERFFRGDYQPAGGWSEHARQVKIRHFLSMLSGFDCDDLATGFACEHAMHDSSDWVQYALDLPVAVPPGQRWAYNSASLILVGEAVARSSSQSLEEFAERHLFQPLGVTRFRWQYSPRQRAWIGGGARMVPREMAKIGQLMLSGGVWKGERVVSEDWVAKSTSRHAGAPGGVDYGFLWQSGRSYVNAELVKAYWASGNGGQYIVVLPDLEMVVVFTGGNYDSPLASRPFELLSRYLIPAFLHPAPLQRVVLTRPQRDRLSGVYALDFEPSATLAVSATGAALRIRSPDDEEIVLRSHSALFFTGQSRYGLVTVEFEENHQGEIERCTVSKNFSSFVFVRRAGAGTVP